MKKRYKVSLSVAGEVHIFFTHALSEKSAYRQAIISLERRIHRIKGSMYAQFMLGNGDNKRIEVIKNEYNKS
jgi:hypothetical protein